MRLDSRATFPSGMEEYLEMYGWHFSKKMCKWASSKMYKKSNSGEKEYIKPNSKETFVELLTRYDVKMEFSYDALYIAKLSSMNQFY